MEEEEKGNIIERGERQGGRQRKEGRRGEGKEYSEGETDKEED